MTRGQIFRRRKAIRLLANNLTRERAPGVSVNRFATPAGAEFDSYEPLGAAVGTYLLVYGLDLAGEKDARLTRFGFACAAAGLRAVIPALPGLKSYRFDPGDLEVLIELADHLHRQNASPIGMIGFSAGGSFALLAACDERIAAWIDPLLLFSPYYTLDDLWIMQNEAPPLKPVTSRDWEHYIWSQLVLAYLTPDCSTFTQAERQELSDMLSRYCDEKIERKLDFYQRLLKGRAIPGLGEMDVDPAIFDRFTLCGKLNRVQGRVFLIHDPADYLIPPEHSSKIMTELQARSFPCSQKLLVTPLISHVTPHYALRWREIVELLDILGELFAR